MTRSLTGRDQAEPARRASDQIIAMLRGLVVRRGCRLLLRRIVAEEQAKGRRASHVGLAGPAGALARGGTDHCGSLLPAGGQ